MKSLWKKEREEREGWREEGTEREILRGREGEVGGVSQISDNNHRGYMVRMVDLLQYWRG